MTTIDAEARARELFLDEANLYGCAETVFIVLKEAYGLPEAGDSAAAMALNGGLAYSGGPCGAVTGAALAVGQLAALRIEDHREAKATARRIIARLMDAFRAEFGATDCRALTGVDLGTEDGHHAFIASGEWREVCTRQVVFVTGRLAPLVDRASWDEAVAQT